VAQAVNLAASNLRQASNRIATRRYATEIASAGAEDSLTENLLGAVPPAGQSMYAVEWRTHVGEFKPDHDRGSLAIRVPGHHRAGMSVVRLFRSFAWRRHGDQASGQDAVGVDFFDALPYSKRCVPGHWGGSWIPLIRYWSLCRERPPPR
jgi:hypothetical protein